MSELRRLFQIAMDAEEYCSTHGLDVESEARRITGERDALFSAAAFEQMRGQMALDTDDDDDDDLTPCERRFEEHVRGIEGSR